METSGGNQYRAAVPCARGGDFFAAGCHYLIVPVQIASAEDGNFDFIPNSSSLLRIYKAAEKSVFKLANRTTMALNTGKCRSDEQSVILSWKVLCFRYHTRYTASPAVGFFLR